MSITDELVRYLRSLGYDVDDSGDVIKVRHANLPIYLYVQFKDRFVYMGINHESDLRDILEDLYDSGEDVESIVEEAISYLSTASLKIRNWIEERGYVPVFKIRDGSIDIYEMIEEIIEEGGL